MDIVVTTPKSEMANADKEAENCIKDGGGYYFRVFNTIPCKIKPGEKVWYVEDGYVRGYAIVDRIEPALKVRTCSTTGKPYRAFGYTVFMRADSWIWTSLHKMKGFQGYRRAIGLENLKPVGGWKDPKPQIN